MFLVCIFIRFTFGLLRRPVKRNETEEWLRSLKPNMCATQNFSCVEYPSHNRKKMGTTEQALPTNHKPEPHVRRLPPESTTLATPLIIYCISSMSFSGWLPSFPA
uniref:Secreted protein n=1 Tax=Mesocestoides corti TaxID=53468 RepID=A0A5K3FJS4_MESCO